MKAVANIAEVRSHTDFLSVLQEMDTAFTAGNEALEWLDHSIQCGELPWGESIRLFTRFPSQRCEILEQQGLQYWYWFSGPPHLLHQLSLSSSFASLVSSRQSHRNEARSNWFRKFLHAARSLSRDDDWWLVFPEIATGLLSEHVSQRFQTRSIQCEFATLPQIVEYLTQARGPALGSKERTLQCWIMPWSANRSCSSDVEQKEQRPQRSGVKEADRLAIHLPDRVHVLDVRKGGNVDQLLQERLEASSGTDFGVRLYRWVDETNARPAHLIKAGAVEWLLSRGEELRTNNTEVQLSYAVETFNPIVPVSFFASRSEHSSWPYLTHCTRGRSYSWNDATMRADWDRWLLEELPDESSPWLSLLHIVESQRLLAAPGMTRQQVATISFSAVPLPELLDRRTYRNHLQRWDWEPYGLCIHRSVLEELGGREVIYGDESTWEDLPEESRPWFQPRYSRNGKIDWQEEREWRMVGNLRLRRIPWQSLFFFVPSTSEARTLGKFFPVVDLAKDPTRPPFF